MNKYYDYIIIGGGPTGLTLALYLSKYNKKVALVEKEDQIGGCHSVKRVNGLFSEHGPRIYLDNYLVFGDILKKELNTSFNELFTKYKIGKSDIYKVIKSLSFRELFILASVFLNLNDNYKKTSFKEFLDYHNFSEKSKDILDRIGRLTDGGGIEKYTLFSFLQIINQNILYNIYQPKKPNDVGLFKILHQELIKRNVDIYLNSEVKKINTNNTNLIINITTDKYIFNADNFIFAIPPININKLFYNNNIDSGFKKDFNIWSENTNYITFIPVIFHWNTKLNIKRIWGYPQTSWGVGYIIMSDYMDFNDDRSKTVISAIITMSSNKSEFLNKTPDEIPYKEIIIKEVFRQLKTIHPNLPEYTNAIMSQNYHNGKEWISVHNAFMTTKYGYLDFNSKIYKNLFNCGVHNGKSTYSFTSLESSIVNAIELLYILVPETKNEIKIRKATTLRIILLIIIVIILIFTLIFYFRKRLCF